MVALAEFRMIPIKRVQLAKLIHSECILPLYNIIPGADDHDFYESAYSLDDQGKETSAIQLLIHMSITLGLGIIIAVLTSLSYRYVPGKYCIP